MSNDDQISYLAGDDGASLTPAERAEMDDLRAALAHPAVWIEPHADLEERVVAAIADTGSRRPIALPCSHRRTADPCRTSSVNRTRWERRSYMRSAPGLLRRGRLRG